jgi:hypothetical protein
MKINHNQNDHNQKSFLELHSKSDFQALFADITTPLQPYYTPKKSGLNLGLTATRFDHRAIEFEGFSRVLWGLAPLLAGGGVMEELEQTYLTGFQVGSDPNSDEYWGDHEDFGQRFVDMAAVGYALLLAPDRFWEPLPDEAKDNLYNWLRGINEYKLPACNWVMFLVIVNLAFKKLGKDWNQEKLKCSLELIESFYLGDGWYQDGDSGHKDYYVSFAIHFYNLIYIREMKQEDPLRCKQFKERAEVFGKQFIYWFDEDGLGIPYGRSLAYRFSQVSFFSACLIAGAEPFSIGVMKGLIVRNLQDWMNRSIFDSQGILSIGYGYPNLYMSEFYNSPGSPYWALKTFAVLMLPDDHPFWSVEAEPMPDLAKQLLLPKAQMLIRRYPYHATAFVPGIYSINAYGQYPAKYSKMAYDTKFSISVSKSNYMLHEAACDSMLAFRIYDYIYVRRICREYEVTEEKVYSKWIPYSGITVETIVRPTEDGHLREHVIDSEIDCEAFDCGFAVKIELKHERLREESNWSQVENDWSNCKVTSLAGGGKGYIIPLEPNTNLLHQMTRIPSVHYVVKRGKNKFVTEITAQYNATS